MLKLLQRKNLRETLLLAALLLAAAALIAAPGEAMEGAKEGIALCLNVITPSLFPFFVLSSLVVDELIGGARRTRTVLIVTAAESPIAKELTVRLERGVTVLEATGAYTGGERQVLMCAVRPSEVYPLRRLLNELDPDAFIIVLNSEQVLGTGFQTK